MSRWFSARVRADIRALIVHSRGHLWFTGLTFGRWGFGVIRWDEKEPTNGRR